MDTARRLRDRGYAVADVILAGRAYTLAELARHAGMTEADALRLWRAWGFPPPAPDDRRFGHDDATCFRYAFDIEAMVGHQPAYHTARVMGLALARIVESEVAMFRSAIEPAMEQQGATDDEIVASYAALVPVALSMADETLVAVHRQLMVQTIRRLADWEVEASPHNVLDTVVGFADLTGSTRLASELALEELDHALAVFEERTTDIVAGAGATIVKRIGDAVMITTPSADVAAAVAVDLVDAFARDDVVPPVRVGLAAGSVVGRRGDFYGLPVALAARLQSRAQPSTVLVSAAVRERVGDRYECRPIGDQRLDGFPAPVPAFELSVNPGGGEGTRR